MCKAKKSLLALAYTDFFKDAFPTARVKRLQREWVGDWEC
jgi:hypothetical protein